MRRLQQSFDCLEWLAKGNREPFRQTGLSDAWMRMDQCRRMNRSAVIASAALILGCQSLAQKEEQKLMHGNVQHLNPAGLHKNPAYSQAVIVSGNATTIYVGGQNAVDASGNIVGQGNIRAQTEKALKNLETALAAGGAGLQHVVKWNVYILHGQSAQAGFEAFQRVWGQRPNPPVITGIFVPALAHPDFLVEIDAIAVVPQNSVAQPGVPHDRAMERPPSL